MIFPTIGDILASETLQGFSCVLEAGKHGTYELGRNFFMVRSSGFRYGNRRGIIGLLFLAKQKKRVPWPKILHMLAGKLMLIAIPFAKLNYMVFSLFVKGFMGGEHSIARGALVWSS